MEINATETKCENCKYYARLYVADEKHFRKVGYGLCRNKHSRIGAKPFAHVCKYWEERGPFAPEEKTENIKKTLGRVAKSLEEIVVLLKLDAEN